MPKQRVITERLSLAKYQFAVEPSFIDVDYEVASDRAVRSPWTMTAHHRNDDEEEYDETHWREEERKVENHGIGHQ